MAVSALPIFAKTQSGESKFIDRMTGVNAPIIKRPIHVLADGTALAVIIDENDSGSSWGTKDNVVKVALWQSNASRSTWTKKVTYNLPAGKYPTGSYTIHAGSCLMLDESIYFVWRDTPGSSAPGYCLYGAQFTKSGTTWTAPTAFETLFQPLDGYPFRFDLDVNRVTGDVVVGWMYSALDKTTNTMGSAFLIRKSSSDFSVLSGQGDSGVGSTGNIHPLSGSEDFTLAVDPMSTATTTRFTYQVSCSAASKDYGDFIGYRTVNRSDYAVIAKGWIKQGINAGRGDGRRSTFMWATANGEFTLVGMGGSATGEGYATRYKTTSAITSTAPVYTVTVPITYTSIEYPLDRDNSLWNDVSVTYANNKFAVIFHDTTRFHNIIGKIASGAVVWETPSYTWDSWTQISPPDVNTRWRKAPPGAVYGGSRRTDASNQHDALLSYFSRTSLASYDTAWAHQNNRPWIAPNSTNPSGLVTTSLPTLGIYADINQEYPRSALHPRWQIASDSGFTLNLKDFDSTPQSDTLVNGTVVNGSTVYIAAKLPTALALHTGLWYLRSMQVDAFGTVGTMSPVQQFTVSHPPSGSNLTPSGSSVYPYGAGDATFSWDFNDGYEFDAQSAYRVVVEMNDTASTVVIDTGKVVSSSDFVTLNLPGTVNNIQLKWRVQLWDIDDNAGALSSYALFMLADPPTVVINSPLEGSVVDSARPQVQWTTTDPSTTGQAAYRVYFLQDGVVIHDSTWKTGPNQNYKPNAIILENGIPYGVVVAVRSGIGLEAQVSTSFTTSWALPVSPDLTSLFADTAQYSETGGGYVRVVWQNQTADQDFLSWRVYRRYHLAAASSASDKGQAWELVHEEFSVSPPAGEVRYEYLDYTAPSGYIVHYTLTQTAVRFGSIIESAKPAATSIGRQVSLYSGKYWLIMLDAAGRPSDAIRLEGATADSYTDAYESEEMHLIGRGRHVEMGDRLGYSGQLTLSLRSIQGSGTLDDPRRQKLDLEQFRATRRECWIRSPFGDLFVASAGDMQFDRVAGSGSSEFTNVTLPYREVYRAD